MAPQKLLERTLQFLQTWALARGSSPHVQLAVADLCTRPTVRSDRPGDATLVRRVIVVESHRGPGGATRCASMELPAEVLCDKLLRVVAHVVLGDDGQRRKILG